MGLILNADGRPFTDLSIAEQVAAVLSRETSATYAVARLREDDGMGDGYGLIRDAASESIAQQNNTVDKAQESDTEVLDEYYFRPSFRSKLVPIFFILLFTSLVVLSDRLLALMGGHAVVEFFQGLGLPITWSMTTNVIKVLGYSVVLYNLGRLFYLIYSRQYYIGPKGVEANIGLYSSDSTRIEYRHMRGVNLRQHVWQKLLGIVGLGYGTLRIATAGDDEVLFEGIANPHKKQMILRERLKTLA